MRLSCVRVLKLLLAAIAVPGLVACNSTTSDNASAGPPAAQSAAPANTQTPLERGKYLVNAAGCNDCHSPKKYGPQGPEIDTSRLLSGHPEDEKILKGFTPAKGSPWIAAANANFTAWSGPWGVSFAANLTPDANTGLRSGVWTEELFIKALRTGKHMGTSRDILPPMPWQDFAQLTDEDLRAIWAYLGAIPPVTNHVPDPIPPPGAPATR
jgi:mono/diheme cytochrome c family protein